MTSFLALGAALAWGLADFSGGFASRKRAAWAVVGWSQAIGLVVLAIGLVIVPSGTPGASDLLLGGAAGASGAIGLGLLYRALSSGVMTAVAPASAASGAVLALLVGLIVGDRLGATQVAGVALAFLAVGLVTWRGKKGRIDPGPVWMAVGAGALFGLFIVLMSFTSQEVGLWPLVPGRIVSISVALLIAGKDRWPPVTERFGWLALSGVLDMLANVLVVLAAQRGPLSIVAVLSGLYPVFTVAAAILYLKERPLPVQVLGLVLGLAAVVLLA